jgi:hypothetical protein
MPLREAALDRVTALRPRQGVEVGVSIRSIATGGSTFAAGPLSSRLVSVSSTRPSGPVARIATSVRPSSCSTETSEALKPIASSRAAISASISAEERPRTSIRICTSRSEAKP